MSLRLRQLHLRIQTRDGLYGTRLAFGEGLTILRAENNMGKSTCIQAIVYALGLEKMLGPTMDIPLPHAMTSYIENGIPELPVLESEVLLEIENARGEILTIQRGVVSERDTRLISTWEGAKLSEPDGAFRHQDYFVRDPGSATREAGFATRLAMFLGWELPTVSRYNGSECPLYLETIFPLFLVEQKHGWAGIQSNLPTFFGIREMGKRALEFVLNLDASRLADTRLRIQQEESTARTEWQRLLSQLTGTLRSANARATGLPQQPTSQWPPAVYPQLEVFRAHEWLNAAAAKEADQLELAELESEPIPTVGESAESLTTTLSTARTRLSELESAAALLLQDIETEQQQLQSVGLRLSSLHDDLGRNQDAEKLREFGAISSWRINEGICPTCHQHVTDSLLPQDLAATSMSLAENIVFIRSQIGTFERLSQNSKQLIERKSTELAALRNDINEVRSQIRAARQSLLSPNASPSIEAVRRRVEVESRLRVLAQTTEDFETYLDSFSTLAISWQQITERKRQLPEDGHSATDREKLRTFEQLMHQQLREFGFSSLNPDSISLSEDTYRPTREGFNLGFDLSASDNIRLIWAYLEGLLELSARFELHHPNLLILDEPRQQETAQLSFVELLRRASTSGTRNQQVIFATSEPESNVLAMTNNLNVNLISIEGRVIKKLQ